MKGIKKMEELNKFNELSWIDIDDIAKALKELSFAPTESTGALIDVIYQLKAMAQNPYNNDYWRVLYNILEKIADNYDSFLKDYMD